MIVDKQVEPAVREAMGASVAGEEERFDAALAAIASRGDAFTQHAVALAFAVGATALLRVHRDERPDDGQLLALAGELADDARDWAPDVTRASALAYLTALRDGAIPALDGGDLAELAFGTGGWLLSSFIPDDAEWTDFLDRILDDLEAPSS